MPERRTCTQGCVPGWKEHKIITHAPTPPQQNGRVLFPQALDRYSQKLSIIPMGRSAKAYRSAA